MVKTGRKSLTLLFILLLFVCSFASVNAQLLIDQREVVKGRAFRFTVEVKGDINDVSTPDVKLPDGIRIISQSKNQSINIINWKKTVSHSFTYSAIALKEGAYSIGPVSLKVDGNDISIPKEEINVVSSPTNTGLDNSGSVDNNILAFIKIDKDRCYVGEQIPVKVIFAYRDTRVRNLTFDPPKSFKDFITYDRDEKEYTTEVKGKRYNVLQLTYPMIPIRTGEFVFDDSQITYDVIKKSSNQGPHSMFDDSFFDDFFNPFDMEKRVLIPEPATLEVVSVPNSPQDFSGGVGKFMIASKIDKGEYLQGEPFEFEITITGVGNIDNINKPVFKKSDDYSISFTGEKKESNIVKGKITGGKKFSYVIIPEKSGDLTIDGAKFVYFDPDRKDFVTINSKPVNIKVQENKDFVKQQNTVKDYSDTKVNSAGHAVSTGADIEFIFTEKGVIFSRFTRYLIYFNIFILLLFISYYAGKHITIYFSSSHEMRLSKTIKRLEKGFENGTFYKDFSNIYWSYLSELLSLKEHKNIASRIMEELEYKIKDKKLLADLKDFKESMELKAYSGLSFSVKKDDLKKSIDLLKEITSRIRRVK